MRKMVKRSTAVFLSFLMVLGLVHVSTYAGSTNTSAEAALGRELEAVEVESSRLDTITAELQEEESSEESLSVYADDEYVTVIVEMEEAPVLDYYSESDYAESDADTTVGEAVSGFLASDEAQELADEVLESQESVILEIADVVVAVSAATAEDDSEADTEADVEADTDNEADTEANVDTDIDADATDDIDVDVADDTEDKSESENDAFEVEYRWSTITNAIAVSVPYGALSAISEVEGVKRAYVEHTYSLPEEEESTDASADTYDADDPNYTYSLDMANVTEAWAEGYTGLGMVVAVLDTGIDIGWGISDDGSYGVTQVHEAFTDDSFMTDGDELYENLHWTTASMLDFLENTQLNSTMDTQLNSDTDSDGEITSGDSSESTGEDSSALYKTLKVPYAYDYADGDANVYNVNENHGCHVSGTVAGYAESDEGEVLFSGAAPDAQILMMKVFGDEDATTRESVIIMALEDSLMLGADVINLSLGSDYGFSDDDTLENDAYDRVAEAGVILVCAAGNASDSDEYNNYADETLASNPDTSTVNAPAVYDSSLAVASIDNTITEEPYFTWVDEDGVTHEVVYADPMSTAIKEQLADGTYPIYYVSGTGTYEDYYNAGFRSYDGTGTKGVNGIAIVERGVLNFEDKILSAESFYESYYDEETGTNVSGCPVQAVLIYDNDPESEELMDMYVGESTLASAFISGKDGAEIVEALQSGYQVYLTISSENRKASSETAGEMSYFSSWGAGPGLELKPEITAPGGDVWSAVPDTTATDEDEYTGTYEMMSGTSMATPHVAGIAALVRQYVQSSSDFDGLARTETDDIVKQLLVSTAVPQTDPDGVYYSPRLQGAGLVNAGAAVTTPAYITVEDQSVGKLELGDDPVRTGEYELAFTVNNISDSEVTYEASVVLMRPGTEIAESYYETEEMFMTDDEVIIKTVSLETITVAANGSTDVCETVSLTEEEKAELDELFVNGTYVEGFVILTDPDGANPQIGLPLLAFYGDWTAAPIFDSSVWYVDADSDYDEEYGAFAEASTWGTSIVSSQIISDGEVVGYVNLGENVFAASTDEDGEESFQYVYFEENFTVSPNGDGYLDAIDDYTIYQLRNAKLIKVEVTDAETGEVYMCGGYSYMFKTYYDTEYGMVFPCSAYGVLPTWDGTDSDGNVLPSGTQCIFTITAYGEGDYPTIWSEEDGMYETDFQSILDGIAVPTFNGHEMDMTGDVISFQVVVDTVAPKLENDTVSVYEVEEEDGTHVYMTGTVYDEDGSIANVGIYPYVTCTYAEGDGDSDDSGTAVDYLNAFYTENVYDAGTKTLTFTADVTEYVRENEDDSSESADYEYIWTGDVLISCGDYGANERSYTISVYADEAESETEEIETEGTETETEESGTQEQETETEESETQEQETETEETGTEEPGTEESGIETEEAGTEESETEETGIEEPGTGESGSEESGTETEESGTGEPEAEGSETEEQGNGKAASADNNSGESGSDDSKSDTSATGTGIKTGDLSLGQTIGWWMLLICGVAIIVIVGVRRKKS